MQEANRFPSTIREKRVPTFKSSTRVPNQVLHFEIHFRCAINRRLRKVAEGCGRLRKVAEGCGRLPKVAEGCRRLPKVAEGCRRLRKVAEAINARRHL